MRFAQFIRNFWRGNMWSWNEQAKGKEKRKQKRRYFQLKQTERNQRKKSNKETLDYWEKKLRLSFGLTFGEKNDKLALRHERASASFSRIIHTSRRKLSVSQIPSIKNYSLFNLTRFLTMRELKCSDML